jgi:polyisoprenyl-phosphate glycosyltransferase
MSLHKPLISIILPCYNEEKNIKYSYKCVMETLRNMEVRYELIYVDDGSSDATILEIQELQKHDNNVVLIEFARNFGKEIATSAGINNCIGDACIIVDVDMQYPIELLPDFVEKWQGGADVVVGVRKKKKTHNLVEILGSKAFYIISKFISEVDIMPGALDFRLIDRKVIAEFNKFNEQKRMTRAIIDWLGFKREYISYEDKFRLYGQPSYTFHKRVKLAFDTFIGTSLVPLKVAGWLGLTISTISGFLGLALLLEKYIFNDIWNWGVTGSASVGLLNLFLTGVLLMGLGMLAIYIGNIHTQVLGRPLYIIRKTYNKK